ncbi:MAG: hypothetical protein L0K86_28535, partial [Actinomycetia bacterium]|nr:hypothetical protein [Actinomycetes bacterium]
LAVMACVLWATYLAVVGAAAGRITGDRPVVGAAIAIAVALVLGFGIDYVSRRVLGTPGESADRATAESTAAGQRDLVCHRSD